LCPSHEEEQVGLTDDVIRVPKAAELVASTLRRQIVTGELKEHDSLPSEALLMQQFRVSRPTLREAFRILESESLILVRRGARGGARVQVPDGDVAARYAGYVLEYRGTTMADVFNARVELEVPLARLLATNAKAKDVARLRSALEEAEEHLSDAEAYAEYDVSFHLLVAELAGNQTLEVLAQMLYHIVGTARRRYTATLDRGGHLLEYRQVHKTHAKLVELVSARDADAAEAIWRKHLVEANKHYVARPMAKTVVEMMQ
jgi:DNA-binding FadR family transcriptional regulator